MGGFIKILKKLLFDGTFWQPYGLYIMYGNLITINYMETTEVTEEIGRVSFTIPELTQRLESVGETQRDIICMYIVGYSMDEIAREYSVTLDFIKCTIETFLADLR